MYSLDVFVRAKAGQALEMLIFVAFNSSVTFSATLLIIVNLIWVKRHKCKLGLMFTCSNLFVFKGLWLFGQSDIIHWVAERKPAEWHRLFWC